MTTATSPTCCRSRAGSGHNRSPMTADGVGAAIATNVERVLLGKREQVRIVVGGPAGWRPRAGRRCARRRQDPSREGRGSVDRRHRRPCAGHRGLASRRHHRRDDLRPGSARLGLPPGTALQPRVARRRDQPGDAARAVGAPRGHGRRPCHGRRLPARPARAVPRARDPEPVRGRWDVPVDRGRVRPVRSVRLSRPSGPRRRTRAAPRQRWARARSTCSRR